MTWRDRWLATRDRLLSDPLFQHLSSRIPLLRPVARRRAQELFDLCAGFVHAQILYACTELQLFEQLAEAPRDANALATQLGLPLERMRLLLDAACALQLLQKRSGSRYGLGPRGAALLGNPGVLAMIRHHALLYDDLRDPVALLRHGARHGQLARYWPYAGAADPTGLVAEDVAPYTALMAQSQPMIAREVLAAYSFAGHRCLLDIGGGDGAFAAAVAARHPGLRCLLFDLPPVAGQAAARFAREGLSSRAAAIGGSFLGDALPRGADVISLIRILHDHDDDNALHLLRAVHAALPAHGTLLIAEPLAEPRTNAVAAYFAFYLLAMGQGRLRRFTELRDMLLACEFEDISLHRTVMPMVTSVVTGHKPLASNKKIVS